MALKHLIFNQNKIGQQEDLHCCFNDMLNASYPKAVSAILIPSFKILKRNSVGFLP